MYLKKYIIMYSCNLYFFFLDIFVKDKVVKNIFLLLKSFLKSFLRSLIFFILKVLDFFFLK